MSLSKVGKVTECFSGHQNVQRMFFNAFVDTGTRGNNFHLTRIVSIGAPIGDNNHFSVSRTISHRSVQDLFPSPTAAKELITLT